MSLIQLNQLRTFLAKMSSTFAKKTDVESALSAKQNKLTFDTVPQSGSTNPVTSDGIYNAVTHLSGMLVEEKGSGTMEPVDIQDVVMSDTQPTQACAVWIEPKE